MKLLISLISLSLFLHKDYQSENTSFNISNVDHIDIDQFGFTYVSIGEKLTRYDKDFKVIASYSEPLLGDITEVDATNALNPVLWFGETYRVGILDNRLNESQILNLLDLGFYDPKLISVSDEQHLWIYDQSEDKLIRFSLESNKRTNESLNVSQILGAENQPNQLYSSFEKIYLNVPEKGILIFDPLGAFLELIAIPEIDHMVLYKNELYFLKKGQISRLDSNGKSEILDLKSTDIKTFDIFAQKIFIVSQSSIEIKDLI